jgi:preprotein translocase subunit SecD
MRIGRIALLVLLPLLLSSCARYQTHARATSQARLEIRLAARAPQPGFAPMVPVGEKEPVYVSPQLVLSNDDIASAEYLPDTGAGPSVGIVFTAAGAKTFADFTAAHVGEMAAILIDGRVTSAPTIRDPVTSGRAQITGQFTEAEAKELAASLRPGR